MHIFYSLPLVSLFSSVCATVYTVPNAPYDGVSVAEFISKVDELDGQKITPYPNSTSYEWWYFDVASTSSQNESITVIFFETLPSAFPGVADSFLSLIISGTLENGTIFSYQTALGNSSTDVATITTAGEGASGVWGTTGYKFEGSADAKDYIVTINDTVNGITGTVKISGVAPAHFPCSTRIPYGNELLFPTVGWANAVPDADANVDISLGGTPLCFTGLGYHDKNWGNVPFTDAVQSWYWGHGRLGPYSVVWFDALSKSGEEYNSGYVTQGETVLEASCASDSVKVRPYGANSDYPPTPASGVPEGYDISFNLGSQGTFDIKAVTQTIQIPGGEGTTYGRYIGPLQGSFAGENYTGTALWEQFKFPL